MKEILIEVGKEFRMHNVAAFRKKMRDVDVQHHLSSFVEHLKEQGAIKKGPMFTTTFTNEERNGEHELDIEFLIPIHKEVVLAKPYVFKPLFLLRHALYTSYVGDPAQIEKTYREMYEYIAKYNLQPITSAYTVNVNEEQANQGATPIIDIYIGVNPSVL